MNNEPWFLHLRKDKFAEVGVTLPRKTWDEMMSAFQKVNKPAENFYAFDGQMTEADWVGNCLQFMWSFGGRLFDKRGRPHNQHTAEHRRRMGVYLLFQEHDYAAGPGLPVGSRQRRSIAVSSDCSRVEPWQHCA